MDYEIVTVNDLPGRFYTSEERSWSTGKLPEKPITEKTYAVLQTGLAGHTTNVLETTSEQEALKKAEKASKLNGPEYVKIVVVFPEPVQEPEIQEKPKHTGGRPSTKDTVKRTYTISRKAAKIVDSFPDGKRSDFVSNAIERAKLTGNPLCRVLLEGESKPRENVEVFTNNQEYGIAFLGDRQVHVTEGFGGWYESGMQLLEAEARLTKKVVQK